MQALQATSLDLRARAALVAATVAIAALTALIGSAGAAASHQTNSAGTPASVPWGFNEDWGWGRADFRASVAGRQLSFAGQVMPDNASANRFHVQWAAVEESRGRYRWGKTDRVYHAMRLYSAQPVMVLYNAPVWARDPNAPCHNDAACAFPPRVKHLDEWRRFVRRAVERYPEVRAIEIWNEPNLSRFWAPRPDPQRYAQLLAAADDAIDSTGSTTPVVTAGLIPAMGRRNMDAPEFLWRIYNNAGAESFDGIGTHPYAHEAPFVENMTGWLDALREVRDANGDSSTPLWITEIGVSTHPSTGVTLEQQGGLLAQMYRSVLGHDVRSFIIHRFQVGREGGYWNGTALVEHGLVPKPAFCALGAAIGSTCADY
jgi:polysaccharide biosynthesis protein PslG